MNDIRSKLSRIESKMWPVGGGGYSHTLAIRVCEQERV